MKAMSTGRVSLAPKSSVSWTPSSWLITTGSEQRQSLRAVSWIFSSQNKIKLYIYEEKIIQKPNTNICHYSSESDLRPLNDFFSTSSIPRFVSVLCSNEMNQIRGKRDQCACFFREWNRRLSESFNEIVIWVSFYPIDLQRFQLNEWNKDIIRNSFRVDAADRPEHDSKIKVGKPHTILLESIILFQHK